MPVETGEPECTFNAYKSKEQLNTLRAVREDLTLPKIPSPAPQLKMLSFPSVSSNLTYSRFSNNLAVRVSRASVPG